MRIYTASLVTETNTFSPFATGWPEFSAAALYWNEADYGEENAFTESAMHVRRLGNRDGHEVVVGPSLYANPSGPTLGSVYERMREEILQQIDTHGPFDAVLLTLHGAMVAAGYDDCEGDLLQRLRERVGDSVFVGAMLDPHCHLSEAMVRSADVITIMKEYPHTDGKERLEELYRICLQTKRGAIRPVSVLLDCHMSGVWPTLQEPNRSLIKRIRERESRAPMISIAFAHGFPWGDVPDAGTRLLVIADDNLDAAEAAARAVADDVWALRDHARIDTITIRQALHEVQTSGPGLLVLADVADNPGGGAPGDSTFILREAIDLGLTGIAAAIIHDPETLQICREAGVGARVDLQLGGKHGAVSGKPIALQAVVRGLNDHHSQQAPAAGALIPLGPTAWIEAAGVHVIVSASRYQAVSPDVFTGMGLDLAQLRAVIVKSTNHFRARFDPIAARTLSVDTPGALSMDLANIPYERRPATFWPRCAHRPEQRVILRKRSRVAPSGSSVTRTSRQS